MWSFPGKEGKNRLMTFLVAMAAAIFSAIMVPPGKKKT